MNSIYVHIPFCKTICSYCDFTKFFYQDKWVELYLDELEKQIITTQFEKETYTIYIGGGTPNCLTDQQLERLLNMLQRFLPCDEFTMECNPESITKRQLALMKEKGVNRLSVGVQSFQDELLKEIGRKHNKEDVFRAIQLAKETGFENISIDMMYNLPYQSIELLEEDLKVIKDLSITHFSYYSLILEEHTILSYQKYQLEDDYEFSEYIKNYPLPFKRYEVSNYALPGYESKHNLVYWHNEHYHGLGCGAHGYINNIRYYNTNSITDYIHGKNKISCEEVNQEDQVFEEVMLGLRLTKGIDLVHFQKKFNHSIEYFYQDEINKNIKKGYLVYKDDFLTTTNEGYDLLDTVLLDFIK